MSAAGADHISVLDVGAGSNPDPRSDYTIDLSDDADLQHDITERWPFPDGSVSMVIANHLIEHLDDPAAFMRECSRVVRKNGYVEITYPVGRLRYVDPTHQRHWCYKTPEYFADNHDFPTTYDSGQYGLTLVRRRMKSCWITLPILDKLSPVYRAIAFVSPRLAELLPWMAGEIAATYRVGGDAL